MLEMTVSEETGRIPVTVIKTVGDIDGSNYRTLIEKAQELHDEGAQAILLDLSATEYMSTAGLVALQSIARLMRGEAVPDTEDGWSAIHSIDRDRDSGEQTMFKLLNPQNPVKISLQRTGFDQYVPIYTDLEEALASF